ncbi:MAG: hypothetical protein KY445_10815, partial [Armatimonadetes bacterium]|nr:hypothetical protein [Armatimonadota bacterium]
NENWLWCGAFCGFCIGTKYFGWLVFGFLGVWFLVWMLQKRDFSVRKLALFALPALIFGAPWYVRNMIWTGNPVFPFAYGIFGGEGWTAQMAADYDASQAIYGFGKSAFDALWVFWRLAMTPLNFRQPFWPLSDEVVAGGKTGLFEVAGLALSSFPGPAVFALGLPALLGRKKPLSIVLATSLFAFLMVFWFVTSQQIRYLLPALGLLALVGGWGAAQNGSRFRVARWVGGAGLGLWLLFAPAWLVWHNRGSFGVLSGAQTPENYLRGFSGFESMRWASNNTPPDAKFAVYGEPRTFYLHRNHFWADDPHNNLIAYATLQNGAQLALALKNLGATHVLWNTAPGKNGGVFGPPQPVMDDAIARGDLGLLYEDRRGYRIYVLR